MLLWRIWGCGVLGGAGVWDCELRDVVVVRPDCSSVVNTCLN